MKLFSPLSYLLIKHDEKNWYDFKIPCAVSLIVTIVYHYHANKIGLISSNGLLLQVNGLLQVLIGFYIAALAAVATFSSQSIDEVMAGDPPTLVEKFRGQKITVELTRRRFVCYLFGYLALVSFMLFCLGMVSILIGKPLHLWLLTFLSSESILWLKTIFVGVYLFILMNIITTTLLGLYFLAVRFHQS
ncbi:hypothetical protein SM084_003030 [Cronobacter sakazakii]|uniref:hypothetical protein n=1 Tax=Cronobacter sakazakii TaxID=28141 RepID=UPI000BE996F0|nr:hypothetical protein [Cronobacter sakazakii]ELY3762635.1 hypothetical protein [Cronobacter sakazakii]ELY3814970.1 hypothetical protein [Cronobacter sakazakii]ELY3831370.1 hypothetical protein [Cronobacter sakazakii]ELY4715247.1 hypothetical protein [Cronobacter sakazakii]MDI9301993.1 hypothetical protein [Cronobacter sakazakii]